MKASEDDPGDGWEVNRRQQLVGVMTTTPLQRLRWLEDAIAFAYAAGALPQRTTEPLPLRAADQGSEPDPS
ncbi:MAG: hypothetical protein M3P11_10210 [Actinomycetota bacterium]|nr:hypothetical protein [Actinomycetota bacterium]